MNSFYCGYTDVINVSVRCLTTQLIKEHAAGKQRIVVEYVEYLFFKRLNSNKTEYLVT